MQDIDNKHIAGGGVITNSHEEVVAEKAEICTQREDIESKSLQHEEDFERKVTFHQLIEQIRESTKGLPQVNKGRRFEELMRRFFLYEPTYKERFSEVWLWDNWLHRNNTHDIGIDLIAIRQFRQTRSFLPAG